ncbi:leader peptidase (prepilin peptidase) / N-methyltransferase [Cytobacillus horneckiae]|uniref:Prepilin peptidase n=1 Tax=Cytobacillus horneckiae TaxID=549687 RepID=A0A2N0ZJY5_9BACI|nr:A24 family peptidase [Cytobacillus horneckiae]NRG43259.1 prepilin peptidase [Bacillus sp. CRN 9]MBN6887879.1 prepilin peptidase [Cytobacillus horneckiae]MEC1155154.1 prepilin peptidase [Cytobacillus horneckiae]MED2935941.1 prepilin peptidase [Cytobacillus horneckiae]PKG29828.1 prepilin peptidase [Cytobacillus horneckiae]
MNIYLFSIFITGLILGSFFNVVGLRVPLKQSIVAPRSACPQCGHQLRALELIPVLSFLFQGGKCKRCKKPISPLYPIVELLTAVLFVMAPLILGWNWEVIIAWTLISLFMIIFVSDVTYMLIPNKILLAYSAIFIIERLFFPLMPWWNSLVGAAVGFVLLLSIAVVSNGGMGGGDIKLFAVIGFVVGTKTVLLSFFLATLYGAAFGIAALLLRKVKRGNPIPFGPFIAVGTLTAYYCGDVILQYYFRLF